jgi:uncharacterized protein with GYD domain
MGPCVPDFEEVKMAFYLVQGSFTPESWAGLVDNPEDRADAVRQTVEQLGGRLVNYFYAFGETDTVVILELADEVSAAAASLAFSASGAFRELKTTPLLTVEEGMEAMRKASQVSSTYRSPAGGNGPR